jgi:hypothetical protein
MTRLIDADELKKCAIPCEIHNGALTDMCVPLYQIDNAPTVEQNEPTLNESIAFHNGYELGKTEFSGFNHGRVVPDSRDGWRYEE